MPDYGRSADPTSRQPHTVGNQIERDTITAAVNRLDNALADVWKTAQELESVLAPILMPRSTEGAGGAVPTPPTSVLSHLNRLGSGVESLHLHLRQLINRAEV